MALKTLFLAIIVAGIYQLLSWDYDRKKWNSGRCPKCHIPWSFDCVEINGDRQYTCPRCRQHIHIVYKVDDTQNQQEDTK